MRQLSVWTKAAEGTNHVCGDRVPENDSHMEKSGCSCLRGNRRVGDTGMIFQGFSESVPIRDFLVWAILECELGHNQAALSLMFVYYFHMAVPVVVLSTCSGPVFAFEQLVVFPSPLYLLFFLLS